MRHLALVTQAEHRLDQNPADSWNAPGRHSTAQAHSARSSRPPHPLSPKQHDGKTPRLLLVRSPGVRDPTLTPTGLNRYIYLSSTRHIANDPYDLVPNSHSYLHDGPLIGNGRRLEHSLSIHINPLDVVSTQLSIYMTPEVLLPRRPPTTSTEAPELWSPQELCLHSDSTPKGLEPGAPWLPQDSSPRHPFISISHLVPSSLRARLAL